METLRKDLVYALRMMRRNKSVTAIILLTLMVGDLQHRLRRASQTAAV
jgi:hypothetical protein